MEREAGNSPPVLIGRRQSELKMRFKQAVRSILTSCSTEDFVKIFPNFTKADKEGLHLLYLQVVMCLHESIENGFESLCLETKVGQALDTVEQLVEEQEIDPLFSDKTNLMDVVQAISIMKKAEIQYLSAMLEKAEEHRRHLQAQIEKLKEEKPEVLDVTDIVEKLKGDNASYGNMEHRA